MRCSRRGVGAFYGGLLARAGQEVHFVHAARVERCARVDSISPRFSRRNRVPPLRATGAAAEIGHVTSCS